MHIGYEAKRRLLVNIGTNILVVVITALIGIWLTPYLIKNLSTDLVLGTKLYGLVPLVLSVSHYFSLFTFAVVGTVSRFVSVHLGREEYEKANQYFNTAFFSLLFLCLLCLIPAIIIAALFPVIFQVPQGYEAGAKLFFLLVIFSSLITAMTSPFLIGTFFKHRFDLQNIAQVVSKAVLVAIILICFRIWSPSLPYVGLSHLGMAAVLLIFSVIYTRSLTPKLQLKLSSFDRKAFSEMSAMGGWITINMIGGLLYLSVDMVVINTILGSFEGGRYAPVAQWFFFLSVVSGAVCNVFTPIAYEFVAKSRIDELAIQIKRATKFMELIMALPIGLICGFSKPILTWWLGDSFADLSPLMWVLIMPCIVNHAVGPMFAINRGLNKVKIPAIAMLIGGVSNLVLSIILVKFTGLGIYGVAMATAICLTSKDIIFTPIYTAVIMGKPATMFYSNFALGIILTVIISLSSCYLSQLTNLATVVRLTVSCSIIAVLYYPASYVFLLNKDEKRFVNSLVTGILKK